VTARRQALDSIIPDAMTHAGLWLDRFVSGFDDPAASRDVLEQTARLRVPDVYLAHFQRWMTRMAACADVRTAEAKVRGRMIVGLGTESVLEVGIALHRTYGVPVIPGSALKGLAARHAAQNSAEKAWRKHGEQDEGASHRALFGAVGEAGCVVFHDALWVPEPGSKLPLDLDVMTVHHAGYYQGKQVPETTRILPPADWDDPNPVPFLTAQGRYLIALEGPAAWTDAAMTFLKRALEHEGIGAKTAAGYGRLDLDYTPELERAAVQAANDAAQAAGRLQEINRLINGLKVGDSTANLPRLFALCRDDERHEVAKRCEDKLGRKPVRSAIKDQKTWVQPLAAILTAGDKGTPS
jgi:CRISPR-associated protein Cmr6